MGVDTVDFAVVTMGYDHISGLLYLMEFTQDIRSEPDTSHAWPGSGRDI